MEDIQIPERAQYRSGSSISNHFHFIGNQISEKELNSAIPFFYCQDNGHEQNQLDQVCIDNSCINKGLTCFRCVNYKHANHRQNVVPLNNFIGDLIKNQSDKQQVLVSELQKCSRYKDFVINQVREFIDDLIEHFQNFVQKVLKYHQIFENQFEDAMIKSDVIVHRILYKQHIRRDYFNRYIQQAVENLQQQKNDGDDFKNSKKNSFNLEADLGYYSFNNEKSQKTKDREYILRDYEKAFEYSTSFQTEMATIAKELKFILGENSVQLRDKIDLHKLSYNIPQFDDQTNQIQNLFKQQYQSKLSNMFGSNPVQMPVLEKLGTKYNRGYDAIDTLLKNNTHSSSQSMPRLPRYLEQQSSETLQCIVNPQRKKVTIGRLFSQVVSSSIMKLNTIKSNQREISCICCLSDDILCLAGRFSPFIEFYRPSDKKLLLKIDTQTQQGIKCLLVVKRDREDPGEWQAVVIAGTYFDETGILSYKMDVLRRVENTSIALSYKDHKKFEKKYNEAVTTLEYLYTNEYFIAGYTSGSVAIFSLENAIPLSVLSNIYDSPVTCLHCVEPGLLFVSAGHEKIRYHHIQHLSHDKIEQKITAYFISEQPVSSLHFTTALNEEGSYLKFKHFLVTEHQQYYQDRDEDFQEEDSFFMSKNKKKNLNSQKNGLLRVLRMVENQNALSEEGNVEIFNEDFKNNSIKDMILIEPRKKQRVVYLITFGAQHKIKLWELKSAFTQTLKLWEKNINDFLSPAGSNAIKAKLLYESFEFTNLKFNDVGPKVQVLSAYESSYTGKILVKFAVVDHASKSEVQIFDVEFLVSYNN